MILRTLLTLTGSCWLLFSFAQKEEAVMEMGTKQMNLHVMEDKSDKSRYIFSFVYDSMYQVKLPHNMWKVDTSTEIDPVSQEEKTVYSTDSTLRVHNYLGTATKQEIKDALTNGFNLSKHSQCNISSVDLWLVTTKGTPVHIEYSQPDQLQMAQRGIESLPAGSMVIISDINFKCPDNQNGVEDKLFTNLAMVKIGE